MIFKGNYMENKKEGQGFFKTTVGTYEGNFRNDEFDGEGCFLWSNKKKAYIGEFKGNKMNGKGKIIYSTGQMVSGEWQNNHNIKVTEEENNSKAEKHLEEIIKKHNKNLKSGN